ncbi:MAG TPA: arylesterase [Pseudomonadales bacterium]|nr:arylesterase [Pseudomonadales bacterium]HRG49623.1 arylesterase [Pseudomonadales bacterium]
MLKKLPLCGLLLFYFLSFIFLSMPARAATVLVFGDSLSAAYGMRQEEGWVALLQNNLSEHRFVNESISGEISANGLKRLPDALKKHKPDVLVLELGANDGLRGMPLSALQSNLQLMINMGKQAGCRILLLGVQLPPNYGVRYGREFAEIYPRLAQKNRIKVIPFFLQDISGDIAHFQPDQLHPTAQAQPDIMATVRPILLSLLSE